MTRAVVLGIDSSTQSTKVIAVDLDGNSREDWAQAGLTRPIAVRPIGRTANKETEWRDMVRRLGAMLDPTRRLHAVAAIEVRPAR